MEANMAEKKNPKRISLAGSWYIFNRGRYKNADNLGSESSKKPGYNYKANTGIGGAIARHGQEIADVNAEIERMNRR
jgi:hypothetical protein